MAKIYSLKCSVFTFFLVSAAFSFGCGSDSNRDVLVDSRLSILGKLKTTSDLDITSVGANYIDQSGVRQAIPNFSLATDGASFSLAVDTDKSVENLSMIDSLAIPYLGEKMDLSAIYGHFGQRPVGYLRLEVLDKEGGNPLAYGQVIVPILTGHAIAVRPSIELSGEWGSEVKLFSAGKVGVQVKDMEGAPIDGAGVFAMAHDGSKVLTLIDNAGFGAVKSHTDDQGRATVYPVPAEGIEPRFQIYSYAPGFCPSLSAVTIFTPASPPEMEMILSHVSR